MKNEEISIDCCGLIAIAGGRRYAWGLGEASDLIPLSLADDTLDGVLAGRNSGNHRPEGTGWWIMFVDDCLFPPKYLVQADSLDDALDIFTDSEEGEKLMKIDEVDLRAYREGDFSFNSNGVAVDTDGLQAWRVDALTFYAGRPPAVFRP